MGSRLMTHLVAFYPDRNRSLEAARALADGGAEYLEVQFPFSDPSADGPVIQEACSRALDRGFTVTGGFQLVSDLVKATERPVFIMSYAGPVVAVSTPAFVQRARDSGAVGLIVPDLPPDYDEGLYAAGAAAGLHVVPVISPAVSDERLAFICSGCSDYIYATLRRGITGAQTEIGPGSLKFLDRLRAFDKRICGGFGISTRAQVRSLEDHVHACIVGSALIRLTAKAGEGHVYEPLVRAVRELVGGSYQDLHRELEKQDERQEDAR